jgi:NADPH-dependent 2,4-dienoyl-CoA reductase/sulfur reductase-like enzyme/nitrite reductase/ring-hydroxylating ferredoxin subunit
MEFKEVVVAKVAELPEGSLKQVTFESGEILLTNVEGQISAIGALCAHYGARLETGILSGSTIVCPWHQACYCAKSGDLKEPPALNALPKYEVVLRGDDVVVMIPEKMNKSRIPEMVSHDPQRDPRTFVILGAGAAGNAAAQSLRQNGYQGRILMISGESDLPYDRPNLDKDFLQGEAKDEWMPLRSEKFYQNRGIELMLGKKVTKVDVGTKTVSFENSDKIAYDKLLLATGGIARKLNVPGESLSNIFTLRTFADARIIVKSCEKASRAVIVGSSFIGLESAASLRKRGLQVTVVAPETVPFERVFGPEIGNMFRQFHEENGVVFRLGTTVEKFEGAEAVKTVVLKDGSRIDTDIVLIGIGVRPDTDYLQSVPKEADGSLKTNAYFRVAEDVYAAGDIARFPDWRSGEYIRIEHWRTAEQQGRDAALNMAGKPTPNMNVPFFWTKQANLSIRYVGHVQKWDEIIFDGDIAGRNFTAFYVRNNEVHAAAGCKRDKQMAAILELMRLKKMPSAADIRANPIDFLELLNSI